jgi:hypothetical protein
MVMTIGETADTFKSTVRPLKLDEISPLHVENFRDIENEVYRFDIPQFCSIKLGTLYNGEFIYVAQEGTNLFLSAHQLNKDPLRSAILKCFLYKPKGNPKSTQLNIDDDAQFVCIPKDLAEGFMINQEIEYHYVRDDGVDNERHVRVNYVS